MNTVILGHGRALTDALTLASELCLDAVAIEVSAPDRYNFDLSPLFERFEASQTRVFVALDERAVNYARHKLIAEVRLAGYASLDLISSVAIVDSAAKLMGNVYIGPGCNVAPGARIELGCWLDRQVILDRDVKLGACVSLQAGVILGQGTVVGKGTTLSLGSVARPHTKIGRHCEWLLGSTVPLVLEDRSFFDDGMPAGARIFKY